MDPAESDDVRHSTKDLLSQNFNFTVERCSNYSADNDEMKKKLNYIVVFCVCLGISESLNVCDKFLISMCVPGISISKNVQLQR